MTAGSLLRTTDHVPLVCRWDVADLVTGRIPQLPLPSHSVHFTESGLAPTLGEI